MAMKKLLAFVALPMFAALWLSAPAGATTTAFTAQLTGTLTDPNVSQSVAYDPSHKVWVFAQRRRGYPSGDLTLTAMTPSGKQINHMYADGFGHGIGISLERSASGVLYVWMETEAVLTPGYPGTYTQQDMYGTRVSRFAWQPGKTVTPSKVTVYNNYRNQISVSLDAAHGHIGVRYWSKIAKRYIFTIYDLAAYRKHQYVRVASIYEPKQIGIPQGWVLAGDYIYRLEQTTAAVITKISIALADVTGTVDVAEAATVPYWEPEGITLAAGMLCVNIAGGQVGTRHSVNVFCSGSA
jgi:hypothetical protein